MPRVLLAQITNDGTTQSRVANDQATITRYAEAMLDGDVFPSVVLFRDAEGTLRPGDGFHRIAARLLAARIAARDGTAFDDPDTIEANNSHGLNYTTADKNKSVGIALYDEVIGRESNRTIAKYCGVSHTFVAKVRTALASGNVATATQEEPAVAKARANGHIPRDAEVTTTRPDPESGQEAEPEPSEPTDKEWLETLPARAQLADRLRPRFDSEALAYRDLEPAREAYKVACKAVTDPLKKEHRGRVGPWLAVHSLHFKIDHPADWQACTDCEGTGILPLVKEKCSTCKGSGYHV